ncbi:hypothetical protein FTX45_18315 [Leclercia adecarboxylata]|nr:hypothetical protein FTX45_18315 [Leclercia adecarboxylata]
MFSESDLTHSDLLRGHYQYVGRSLKVNGSFCRDTYSERGALLYSLIGTCKLNGTGFSSTIMRTG